MKGKIKALSRGFETYMNCIDAEGLSKEEYESLCEAMTEELMWQRERNAEEEKETP